MEDSNKVQVAFAAIDQKIIQQIPENVTVNGSNKYAMWGKDNRYPVFLYDCYKKCPTLQTIVNGFTDYIVGDGITSTVLPKPNPSQSWDEFVTLIGGDYILFGVAYIEVIRKKNGIELFHLDSRFVRTDDDNNVFYYNEDFGKTYVRSGKSIVLPRFIKDSDVQDSVVCIKTPFSRGTYGIPIYESAIKSVMAEMAIDDFHLSELDNNFTASAIINFNNGVPEDEEKSEIEKMVRKKFTGSENAGGFMLSFNNGKDNATTVERLATDDFDKRYIELAKKTQKQIFTAFGVSPVVFGVERENTGFSDEDFQQAFKLFNRTKIQPTQKRIIDFVDKILGTIGSISIKPFSIDWGENNIENSVN